jgi:hypothetical protein
LKITLNGVPLHSGPIEPVATRVTGGTKLKIDPVYLPLPAHFVQVRVSDPSKLKRGRNTLTVEYTDGSADALKLVEVQLGVTYRTPSSRSI